MIRAIILFALLPLFSAAHATTPSSKPLFELAVDYTKLKRIPICYRDTEGALYPRCYKAEDAYNAALARAKAENKPLMIIWGFDECSACRFLENREFNPAEPWMTDRFATWALSEKQADSLGNNGNDLEILLLRINSRSPSGQALSKKLGVYKIARDRGGRRVWSPFITMTNPATGQLVTQTSMRANQQPCNRWDEYALNLEDLGYIPSDDSYERRIC